jgi:putative endonuclease
MVRCAKGALYTGIALDVLKRVAQHNAGTGAKAIHALGRPVKLVYSEIVGDKRLALKREYMIKHMTRVQKEKLIASQWLTSEDQTYYRAWD